MSTYWRKRKYYTGTDYYSSVSSQEYGDDNGIGQNAGYTEEYQQPVYDYSSYYQGNQQPVYDYGQQSLAYNRYQYDEQALQRYRDRRKREENRRQLERGRREREESYRQPDRGRREREESYRQPDRGRSMDRESRRQPYRSRNISEEERRQARRNRRMREERRRRRRRRLFIALAVRLACLLVILAAVISLARFTMSFVNPVKRKVTVEAGTELDVKDFLKREKVKGSFVTDISKVSLDHVGEREIILKVRGKERKSRLIVEDTKAPKAESASVVINVNEKLEAKDLVKNIQDATDVKCSFKEKPDLSKADKITAGITLTDEGGNTKEVISNIEVVVDREPPVMEGIAPLTGYIGEPISYKSTLTVTDNCMGDIDVQVDSSKVDTNTEGTYDVIYTAVDRAGNKAEASTTVTIMEKPEN
ncbi:DUF5011 domain-containing protein [Lachnospiraceae bacterium MD308]|nr:DUF5011 domain-containing protein [Lachnospiraceae bacterium MD308]